MMLCVLLLHPIVCHLLILSFCVGRRNYLAWAAAACCSLFGLIGAVDYMVCLILVAIGAQGPVVESLAASRGSCSTSEVVQKSLLWGGAGS